jgi:hypothetical protein
MPAIAQALRDAGLLKERSENATRVAIQRVTPRPKNETKGPRGPEWFDLGGRPGSRQDPTASRRQRP